MEIEKIGIIGAGAMGGGIAQVAAQSGFRVILGDLKEEYAKAGFEKIKERLEKRVSEGKLDSIDIDRILSNVNITENLQEYRDSDLIIEAVVEKEDIKKQIFRELDSICPEKTVFASNTSSISITRLGQVMKRPDRFAGMHFMNPAFILKLVEVVQGVRTSKETVNIISCVAERMGKIPIAVNDYPGFIANRLLMPMINDAIYCLEDAVTSRENIDKIMKLGANHPMGPLELSDFIGLDVCLAILEVLHEELGEKYMPSPLLRKMVAGGKLGRKSGEGFYEYR
jgi:3-hydroxybutyryl-CoA dehydrogenase